MSAFVAFPADWPDTATRYGPGANGPSHAAFRGEHRLPHQCQQIRRDLFAEDLARARELRCIETTEDWRQRVNCPYLYLVQDTGGTPCTAFRTRIELDAWLDAYGLALHQVGNAADLPCIWRIVRAGPLRPLTCRLLGVPL